ncbi:MAG: hypothetical protein U0234_31925 [Sandaracinus sp.]
MGVRVKQPSASEDRPKIVSTSIVGVVALGVGLWLAHGAMGHPAPEAAHADEADTAFAPPASEGEAPTTVEEEEEEASPASPEAEAPSEPAEPAGEPVAALDHEAPHYVEPQPVALTPTPTAPAPTATATPAPTATATPSTLRTPPPRGTGVATHVRRGRVAYLRCDGAPQTSGPFPCPRDAALEASVWSAVDQSTACTPPLPPGNVDLVIEWERESGASAPTIATRDTFPDDALRSDAAGVIACLTPALSTLTTTIPGDRIRVGFRFELE